jgi:hypothetical protein
VAAADAERVLYLCAHDEGSVDQRSSRAEQVAAVDACGVLIATPVEVRERLRKEAPDARALLEVVRGPVSHLQRAVVGYVVEGGTDVRDAIGRDELAGRGRPEVEPRLGDGAAHVAVAPVAASDARRRCDVREGQWFHGVEVRIVAPPEVFAGDLVRGAAGQLRRVAKGASRKRGCSGFQRNGGSWRRER